jgi:selenocysteine-specific elongation factor
VLDAAAFPPARQKKEERLAFLREIASGTREQVLLARISRRGQDGLTLAAAVRETGLRAPVLLPVIKTLNEQGKIIAAGDLFVASGAFRKAGERALAALDAFHRANPLVGGISKEQLREKLQLQPAVMETMLAALTRDKKAEVTGEQVRLAGRGVELKDEEAKAKEQIEKAFASAGLKVPLMKEVLASLPVDRARAQKLVTLLLRDRVLVKVADEMVFHHSALERLRQLMAQQKAKSPKIDVGAFKDLLGVTRKYAIPLLEYLDQQRVTRRVGDERIIL